MRSVPDQAWRVEGSGWLGAVIAHQHGWGLPLLVNGTTLLVQGEATQSPCVLALNLGSVIA